MPPAHKPSLAPSPPCLGSWHPAYWLYPQAPGPRLCQLCPPLCARESFAPICRREVAAVASSHRGFLSIRKLSLNLAQQELERFDSTHGFWLCQVPGTWELRRAAALPAGTLETVGPHVLPGRPEARGADLDFSPGNASHSMSLSLAGPQVQSLPYIPGFYLSSFCGLLRIRCTH